MKSNFIGRSKEYYHKIKHVSIPSSVKQLKHAARWPISLDTSNIHLACYFGEDNYSSPGGELHNGVDIQVDDGILVNTPSSGKVVKHWFDPMRKLFDVSILSNSGILYEFCHLETFGARLPRHTSGFDYNSDFMVRAGDVIGKVGRWPYDLEEHVNIPFDVEDVHGKKYHHLHFGTKYDLKYFNPLGLIWRI
jgi:hypothetical protein